MLDLDLKYIVVIALMPMAVYIIGLTIADARIGMVGNYMTPKEWFGAVFFGQDWRSPEKIARDYDRWVVSAKKPKAD